MKKQKYYYYIGVQTNSGLILVTDIKSNTKYAEWNKDKPPMPFAKSVAESISEALCWNGFVSVIVRSLFELPEQFI